MELVLIQSIVGILAGLMALGFAWPKIWKWVTTVWIKTLGRNAANIECILAELQPNGGASIKDSLDRIENRLGASEAFQNANLNIQDVAILRANAEGHVTNVNRAWQRLTGLSKDEAKGSGWINSVRPEDRASAFESWVKAVESGREFSEEIEMIAVDKTPFTAIVTAYREIDNSGNLRGYIGVIIPVEI